MCIRDSPEYRMLAGKSDLAREQMRLARSERLPQIGLAGNYGYLHGLEVNGQNLLGSWGFSAGIRLSVPNFHFGTRSNRFRSARAKYEQEMCIRDSVSAANFRNTPKRTPDETAGRAAVRPPAAGAVPRGPATGDAGGMRPERRAEGSARGTESRRPAGTDAGEGGALLLGKLADGRRCRRAAAAQAPAPPARGIPHRTGGARGRFAVDRRAHRRPARSHPPR